MRKTPVSIGICAHNEEDTIGKLIDQVMREKIPIKEVIVVVAGDDSSAEIVDRKSDKYDRIDLIIEKERQGQIVAQNKIISRSTGEALLFLDGDGLIKPGSLEALYEQFDGSNAVAGKEIPVTKDSFLGRIIDVYGKTHHQLCGRNARFSTHLGIIPSDLIETFPEVVLDDVYVEHKCIQNSISIEYVPEAVKYHNTPNDLGFFFHQQKKNWAGRFQAQKKGFNHSKPESLLLKTFLDRMKSCPVNELPALIALGILEVAAYGAGKIHKLAGDFPKKWWRPKNSRSYSTKIAASEISFIEE